MNPTFRNLTGFCILSLLIVISSCSGNPEAKSKADPPAVSTLAADEIFEGDLVKRFVAAGKGALTEAKKLFLTAVNVYRNEKDPAGSIPVFIQSICKNPDSQVYYEMGNACMDAGKYDESILCYEMAEKLGYEPFSKVLYNLACVYSYKKNFELSANYLEASLQAGYSNIDQISKDKDLELLRTGDEKYRYNDAVKNGLSGMSDPDQLFWLQFRKGFAKVKKDFALNGEKRQYKEEDYVSFDYEKYISELRTEKFSREVGRSFYCVAEIDAGENIVALIYAEEDPYAEVSPIIYRLATFTNEGVLIDKKIIAGMEDYHQLMTAKFSGRKLTIKTFEVEYAENVDEKGLENNKITDKELVETQSMEIGADGKIHEEIKV